MRSLPARWLGAAAAILLVASGCSTTAAAPAWTQVALPGDVAAVTLTAYRDAVLVGTRTTGDAPAPGLARVRGGDVTALAVTPASGYGREARWLSIAADPQGGLVAVGGERGGAHANVRWSVWRGSSDTGLTEEPQPFQTFGGWGAGELVGAVAAPAGPALVGSWESRQAALDAAVWLPQGAAWVRQDSAGTALESTPQKLVGPVATTSDGSRILVVGSLVRLGDGSVRRLPAVWRSTSGASGWSRTDLPGGTSGEASAAVCRPDICVVVGRVDERLAVWRFDEGAQRLDGVPDTAIGDRGALSVAPLADDSVLIAVPEAAGSRLLRQRGSSWESLPGPPGPVRSLVVFGTLAYAVAPDSGGVDRLWRAPL